MDYTIMLRHEVEHDGTHTMTLLLGNVPVARARAFNEVGAVDAILDSHSIRAILLTAIKLDG